MEKKHIINVRLSEQEAAQIKTAAKADNRSVAGWSRIKLIEAARSSENSLFRKPKSNF